MFKEKTVFILGAGASWHYGYPTGADLIKKVIQYADRLSIFLRDDPYTYDNIDILNQSLYPRNNLIEDCKNIVARLKQTNALVIDYFLEQNEDLRDIGKFLIAWVLIEDEIAYHKSSKNRGFDYNKNFEETESSKCTKNQDWYRFLIYKILADIDIKNPSQLYTENNVSFITFNYDVSLEHRLFSALSEVNFLKSDQKCVDTFMNDNSRFIHVYGQLRPISKILDIPKKQVLENRNQDKNFIFENTSILISACEAAERINIIPELKDGNKDILDLAKNKIEEAERVYILGYGFDDQNNNRIGLRELSIEKHRANHRKIYFTNFGDKDSINRKINNLWGLSNYKYVTPFYRGSPNFIEETSIHGTYKQSTFYYKSSQDTYTALESDFDFL